MQKYKLVTLFENYNYSDDVYPSEIYWDNIKNKDINFLWKELLNNLPKDHKLFLYINIPFCESQCFYCTHDILVEKNINRIDYYLDNLEKEVISYSNIFKNNKFKYLYIGGGTPTILSSKQLDRLYKILFKYFNLDNIKSNMIEFSPNTVSEEKIKIIKKYGVGKVTFGIQDINENLMKKNNRFQSIEKIELLVDLLDKYDICFVSVDIMAGLKGQNFKNFKETLDYVLNLKISNICLNIYKETNKVLYKKDFFDNKYFDERKKMINYWRKIYSHRDNFYLKKEIRGEQLYNFDEENMSVLGIGYGANSHIYGSLYYKKNSLSNYYKFYNGSNKDINLFRGIYVSTEDEIIKYIIINLKENGISLLDIKNIFGNNKVLLKIEYLFKLLNKKNILDTFEKEGNKYFRFRGKSDLLYNIYCKLFYNKKYLKKIEKKLNFRVYSNIDVELEKYFIN